MPAAVAAPTVIARASSDALVPDTVTIQDWLSYWFHHAVRRAIQIGWRAHGGSLTHFLNLPIGADDLGEQIAAINAHEGHSVYFRASTIIEAPASENRDEGCRAASDQDFAQGMGVWVDLDDPGAAARAAEIEAALGPCAFIETGRHPHWRAQAFWRFDDPCADPAAIRALNQRLCAAAGGDAAATNPTRLMRVPGTIAWPAKPGRIPELTRLIFPAGARREWYAPALEALVPPVPAETGNAPAGSPDASIEDVRSALAAIPNEDRSWDEWSRIGMAAWRASGGAQEAFAAWKAWSAKSRKHSDEACDERWRHWFRSPPTLLGFGTLHHLAQQAKPLWVPPSRTAPPATSRPAAASGEAIETDGSDLDPLPLVGQMDEGSPFPMDALLSLGDAARAVHGRTQAPVAMCAQAVLAACTLAVMPHFDVVMPRTGRRPLTNFFLTIVGSGQRKSAVDEVALAPVRKMQQQWRGEYDAALAAHKRAAFAHRVATEEARSAAKGDPAALKARLERLGDEPKPPLSYLLLVRDPTMEGLIAHMQRGRPWAGLFCDEGGVFLGGVSFIPENIRKTAGHLNDLWGLSEITQTRVSTGTVHLPPAGASRSI
jgi:hypothetical protein